MTASSRRVESKAPLVLFVYARPWHTEKTLAALKANTLARETSLIVYSDGPRSQNDAQAVQAVRAMVRSIEGFKSVSLIERPDNMGLANNIVQGLNEVFQHHERAIVLEDDIECSSDFLTFMNEALDRYEYEPRVWHINGWNHPIPAADLPATYCSSTMNCWGWASWRNRWQHFNPDAAYFIRRWSLRERFRFNLDGSYPFYSHLIANQMGARRTWAIFWYAAIFDANGLCIQPAFTLTREIGSDGSGTHGLNNGMYSVDHLKAMPRDLENVALIENQMARQRVKAFNRRNFAWIARAFNTLKLFIPMVVFSMLKVHR